MEYPKPSYTADIVVFHPTQTENLVLLIQRKNEPFAGDWALPGGFVEAKETGREGAIRELQEETGLTVEQLTPLGIFDAPGRDPRGWTISQAFYTYSLKNPTAGDDAAKCQFFSVNNLPTLAFDHHKIIRAAVEKTAERWHYTQKEFDAATKELKAIIEKTPNLVPHPRTRDCWEICNVCDFQGTEPQASARFLCGDQRVSLRVTLQDDGGAPYAVCSLKKFLKMENHHVSHTELGVEVIYPSDHHKIPALVASLLETPIPKILDGPREEAQIIPEEKKILLAVARFFTGLKKEPETVEKLNKWAEEYLLENKKEP